jgi:hypothetical protein
MDRLKRFLVCPLMAVAIVLSGCLFDHEKLAARNKEQLEARKKTVTDHMEECLNEKYAGALGKDSSEKLFEVYDLSKGTNQAWFNRGTYPAKAKCSLDDYSNEFSAEIYLERNGDFGVFKDSFYGILYGVEVKQSFEEMVSEYPITDTNIFYMPNEDIVKEEAELKKNLYIFGRYDPVKTPEDVEKLCGLIDKLNEMGCIHAIAITDGTKTNRSMRSDNITSSEIRDYFKNIT